jgi:hypothetical protein
MKYACALAAAGALLFAVALQRTMDIFVFQAAIAALAGAVTWAFLILKRREAERSGADEGVSFGDGEQAA